MEHVGERQAGKQAGKRETAENDRESMRQDETSESEIVLSSSGVERPRKRKQDEKKYKCPSDGCDAIFVRPSRLARHVRSHTGEKSYKCDHEGCEKAYTNACHLKRHKKTHSVHKTVFKCPACQLSISNKQNLKRHYQLMHSEESKSLSCDECGEKFRKKYQLATHKLQQHKEGGSEKCDHCEKKFTSARALKRHRASHEERGRQKRYRCSAEGCEAEFGKWLLLCAHAKTHGTRCEICGKEFSRRWNLKVHRKTHKTEKEKVRCPYEGCDRIYGVKRNLNPHVRTTHFGERYECDVCSARYTSKAKVRQHIERWHGDGVEGAAAEERRTRRKKSKTARKRRKDAGIPKRSAISALVGLNLPTMVERAIMKGEGENIIAELQEQLST